MYRFWVSSIVARSIRELNELRTGFFIGVGFVNCRNLHQVNNVVALGVL